VGRLAGLGLDVFQFLRPRGNDPLAGSGETLAKGLTELRARGYRRIVVAGHSRGAWIALTAMAHPGLADAIVALSAGAHGTAPARQPQARADWQALWASANAPDTRVVLVQLRDDPYDPDPAWRLDIARKARVQLTSIFLPPEPVGHVGAYLPAFDEQLGAEIAAFSR
jgi:pimeloyl-ACP methyl ester carboxylesterase